MMYALDTNILLSYLNAERTIMAKFRDAVKNKISMVIPKTVDYEVMRGFYHTPCVDREATFNQIKKFCPVIEIEPDMWDCAAQIWAQLWKMNCKPGDADLLIASQCIVNGYTLITNNTKHFKPIVNLNVDLTIMNW